MGRQKVNGGYTSRKFYSVYRDRQSDLLDITCYGIELLCLPVHITLRCQFLYVLCVFLDHIRFALLPRHMTTEGLTYPHMSI